MLKNRLPYVFIVLALAVAAGFAFIPSLVTKAAGKGDQIDSATRSYTAWAKVVQQQNPATKADDSYTQIETLRLSRSASTSPAAGTGCIAGECSYQLPNGQWVR